LELGETIQRTDERAVDADQLVEVASRYYLEDWSQTRIGEELGLHPSTVSRMLKRARLEGFVHVEIRRPPIRVAELERDLAERFGLARAVVVQGGAPRDAVGQAAADFVDALLQSNARLGISWGHTLAAVVRHLAVGRVSGLTVAQLAGGIGGGAVGIHGHELVRQLVDRYPRSLPKYLHAPAIVDSAAIKEALVADSSVADALRTAANSQVALVGVGSIMSDSTLVAGQHISEPERAELEAAGAVGNVNTRFYDISGQPVGDLEERTIAISWQELRAIPTVIAVAAGAEKSTAILGALRSRCIDVLVTEQRVAEVVLQMAGPQSTVA
jgi:DNA-binding transcriptional regulator LsrR (DeoR family)